MYIVEYYFTLLDLYSVSEYEDRTVAYFEVQNWLAEQDPAIAVVHNTETKECRIWIHNGEETYRVRNMDDFEDRVRLTLDLLCIPPEHSKSVNREH